MYKLFVSAICLVMLAGCPIYTIEDLQKIGNDPEYPLDGYYMVMNDLNAIGFDFQPIGGEIPDGAFSGVLNGRGFRVSNLQINQPEDSYVGLFKAISGEVSNLHVSGVVTGKSYVGILAGGIWGTVTQSSCVGEVTSSEGMAGGFTGLLFNYTAPPLIANCYAHVDVIGSGWYTGGFVGNGTMYCTNCYSIGSVINGNGFGGYLGPPTNCYYDSENSGCSDTGNGEPRTTLEMQTQSNYVGWDFVNIWKIAGGYPYLTNE